MYLSDTNLCMKKHLVFIIIIISCLWMSNCKQPEEQQDVKFDVKYISPDISGSYYELYSHGDYLIGRFIDSVYFFVLDSNYRHVKQLEDKLNGLAIDVHSVEFYKGDMLISGKGDRLVVFDANFDRKTAAEKKLAKYNSSWMYRFNDTIYLTGAAIYYAIVNDYDLLAIDSADFRRKYDKLPFDLLAYSDSMYDVYACGNGEFGGSVYFRNKKTDKLYSLPTYFGELFYCKGKYHLIHSYDAWSKYIIIRDPTKLYPAQIITEPAFCCTCDSNYKEYFYKMKPNEVEQWNKQRGVKAYYDTNSVQTIKTFIYRDNLYSLCMSDSSFHILQHMDDSVRHVQSFPKMEKRINVYAYKDICSYKNKTVIGLNGTFWSNDNTGTSTQVNQTGLVVIDTNKATISVYEFYKELPYKEPNH